MDRAAEALGQLLSCWRHGTRSMENIRKLYIGGWPNPWRYNNLISWHSEKHCTVSLSLSYTELVTHKMT